MDAQVSSEPVLPAEYVAVGWMCEEGEHLRQVAWQRHTILTKPWCDLCFVVYRQAVHIDGRWLGCR